MNTNGHANYHNSHAYYLTTMPFTKKESAWIARLQKAAHGKPANIVLYVIDGDRLYACRKGDSSNDTQETINLQMCPTNMIPDIHDDRDNGRR